MGAIVYGMTRDITRRCIELGLPVSEKSPPLGRNLLKLIGRKKNYVIPYVILKCHKAYNTRIMWRNTMLVFVIYNHNMPYYDIIIFDLMC